MSGTRERLGCLVEMRSGPVRFPAYMPVTTFGDEYPTDRLIQPFMGRCVEAAMVSAHHARDIGEKTILPTRALFVDSGGFACLLNGFEVVEREDGTGVIEKRVEGEVVETITPEGVLEMQARVADMGATLDFPVPPSMTDQGQRDRWMRLTLANARWARAHHTGPMVLFGSVQGYDVASYVRCATEMVAMGFESLAIGGLVPRQRDRDLVVEVCSKVRAVLPAGGLLHVFGVGRPDLVGELFDLGVSSVDSSSYVQSAASGKRWDGQTCAKDATPLEVAHAAVWNLRFAVRQLGLEIVA